MSGQSDDRAERQGWPWFPWAPSGGSLPPLLDGSLLTRGASLYGNAVRDQMLQWQRSLEKLSRGAYGPQDATLDLQESTRRAIGFYTQLAGLWWGAGTRRGGSTTPGEPASAGGPAPTTGGPPPAGTAPPSTHPQRAAPPAAGAARPAERLAPPRPQARRAPAAPRPASRPAKRSALAEAELFLRRELTNGPRPARELQELARTEGISKTTLQRAKRKLGIQGRRGGFGPESRVVWELSTDT